MKKLQESGVLASVQEAEERERVAEAAEADSALPVILKKESDQLGMLEYNRDYEDRLLRAIIIELKPRTAAQMLPGMPAYVLFMVIRY